MIFNNFTELRNSLRVYNSNSILDIGSKICWQISENQYSEPLAWLLDNAKRNYAVRLMLLASAGNPHRHKNINSQEFENLINVYHNWGEHTIAYPDILDKEAETILESIQNWENKNAKKVRNWTLKLSDIFGVELIRQRMAGLFLQRQVAFQNAGFGQPFYRIERTIKFIDLLKKHSSINFSENFINSTGLSSEIYFKQFWGCLALLKFNHKRNSYFDFSQLPIIDDDIIKMGITPENLMLFMKQNSAPFHLESNISFRTKVKTKLNNISELYKPFFYNVFLETPLIELNKDKYCLPDPFSFTESCWNQIEGLVLNKLPQRELGNILSDTFEDYLENVLFPYIAPCSFEKIPEVQNPANKSDKRADFLIKLQDAYIVVECKSSVMHLDASTYFHPEGIADVWCRIHSASEQIAATIQALNLRDKPVIPLIMTFYDNITSSQILEIMIKQTDYCKLMGLNISPIVRSLHEFEHWISDRSIGNWADLILTRHNTNIGIKPDSKGHNYQHLKSVPIIDY
ncbi:hypothetical protein CAL7716_104430 (plasmid) [Calothrix sp. PCC 7716]|nr:hypothetical protein CAL7716_104430 [Calothrix sp. PCC 7716]